MHTKGKWKIVTRKDDSYDSPYYEYHIVSYPYGKEAGPQRIAETTSKFDAEHIVQCCNEWDRLVARDDIMVDALAEIKAKLEGNPEQPMSVIELVNACIEELGVLEQALRNASAEQDES